jgi:hypothetical protein
MGQLINMDSQLILDPFMIRTDLGLQPRNAQIIYQNGEYFIAWIEGLNHVGNSVNARRVSPSGELLNGDSDSPGIIVAAPWQSSIDDTRLITFDALNLSADDENYWLLWSSYSQTEDMGIYGTKMSFEFEPTKTRPIVGIRGDSFRFLNWQRRQPTVLHNNGRTFATWPVSSGHIEGFNIDHLEFKKIP